MPRVVNLEIAGKSCWLNFSVAALFRLGEHFGEVGTIEAIWRAILPSHSDYNIMAPEIYDNVLFVAAELLAAGAAYHKLTTGEDAASFTADELQVLLGRPEYFQLHTAVIEALQAGLGRTVETEEDPKNRVATQGN